jgi:hypothetical protein
MVGVSYVAGGADAQYLQCDNHQPHLKAKLLNAPIEESDCPIEIAEEVDNGMEEITIGERRSVPVTLTMLSTLGLSELRLGLLSLSTWFSSCNFHLEQTCKSSPSFISVLLIYFVSSIRVHCKNR